MNNPKIYKVIIVGAGVAGLSAANFLYRHGIEDILVLEAKENAGGRIQTTNFGGEDRVEIGAQWIHGEDNDFCRLVKASDHRHEKFSWEGKGDFLLPNGDKVEESIVTEILDWLELTIEYVENTLTIDDIQKDNSSKLLRNDSSMGGFLKSEFLKYLDGLGIKDGSTEYDLKMCIFQWGMSFQRIDNSCNQMTDLSLFRWSEFEVNPGEHYNNFKEGASSFIDKVLVGSLPQNAIVFNSPVVQINWEQRDVVELKTENGNTYSCTCVLLTCSIGVLKDTHENLFHPRLPSSLTAAINSTGFGPVAKIFLKWNKPWWPDTIQGFQFLWPKHFVNCCDDDYTNVNEINELEELRSRWPKSITGFDPVVNNPNVLLGWLGGPEAVFVESLTDSEVGCVCAKILNDFTGYNVPQPDAVLVSKWNTDKYIRGAYSFRSVKGEIIPGDITSVLSEPVLQFNINGIAKPAIILAGEALSKTHYSTLHGAFETGESQAAKLIEYFRLSEITDTTSKFDMPKSLENPIEICSKESMSMENRNLELDDICSLTNKLSQKVKVSS